MTRFKKILKRLWAALLGKELEPVIVCALSGEPRRAHAMQQRMRELIPDLRHIVVTLDPSLDAGQCWLHLRRQLAPYRIALAAVLFDGDTRGRALRCAMLALAPTRILAFNRDLHRHHLRLTTWIASTLFLRGVPLDRIFLRPSWLVPWKGDRSAWPGEWRCIEGRAFRPDHPRVAVLSPYLPWPLSHGGAVRLWSLLRETAHHYDIVFFGFEDGQPEDDLRRLGEIFPRTYVAGKPRYREPRWSTLSPPEVCEFYSEPLHRQLHQVLHDLDIPLLQVEYTQMADYGGEVLTEHDITYDLFAQIHDREQTLSSWWDWWRWRRYERAAVQRYRRVVTMSEKDSAQLAISHAVAIPNGVDLHRFRPTPEIPGAHLLFIGSFRHFPNVRAYRFFAEEVWPLLEDLHARVRVTVVAGPDPHLYWNQPPPHPAITVHGFVPDVAPLYEQANLVLVPTLVSAGTNLKALEAMAMQRAIVSTPAGVAGLGLVHGESVWIGDTAEEFAVGIRALLNDPDLRGSFAGRARLLALERYAWPALARLQVQLWDELHPHVPRIIIRDMREEDLPAIAGIQAMNPDSAGWNPRDYLAHQTSVIECDGVLEGFLVTRETAPSEIEILDLAIHQSRKRRGLATRLLECKAALRGKAVWLEVRESNTAARSFYRRLGFEQCGLRPGYYKDPPESGIVMRWQTW